MNHAQLDYDLLLVGGGLQNLLAALAMRTHRPDARIAMIERDSALGGNHTWCFHASDVSDEARAWIAPLITASWPEWEVRFPSYTRRFQREYSAISSERAHAILTSEAHARHIDFFFGRSAVHVSANEVVLDDGKAVHAPLVIDSRGPRPSESVCGFQKFVGLELELKSASPITTPILIDADLTQRDGFRFIYVLPLSTHRVLVEETFFSDTPSLDDADVHRDSILAYAERARLDVDRIGRMEQGVLPLPLTWPVSWLAERNALTCAGVAVRGGFGGGWFHPTTGYSFPVAVRLATHLAQTRDADRFGESWHQLVTSQNRQARFSTLLNRLLFRATLPENRRDVFERFHSLSENTITRFYAHASSSTDRMRMLCGIPPEGVSFSRAVREVVA
jgi:lycopene beta-cyclase